MCAALCPCASFTDSVRMLSDSLGLLTLFARGVLTLFARAGVGAPLHGDTWHRVGMLLRWRGLMATSPFSLILSFCKEEGRMWEGEEGGEGVEGRRWVADLHQSPHARIYF